MRKSLLVFALLLCAGKIFSQGEIYDSVPVEDSIRKPHHVFYVELLGNSGLYSLNYEVIVLGKENLKIFSRVGAGPLFQDRHFTHIYLLEENFCFGKEGRFLEAGFGLTFQRKWVEDCAETKNYGFDNLYWGIIRLGVRFQSQEKGSVFRIGLTPSLFYKDQCETSFPFFQFMGGLSYGLVF